MSLSTTPFNQFVAQCDRAIGAIEDGCDWQASLRRLLECSFDAFNRSERTVARTILLNVFARAVECRSEDRLPVSDAAATLLAEGDLRQGLLSLLGTISGDGRGHGDARAPSAEDDPRLGPAMTYIRDRYADSTLTLADAARQSNLSKWHFDRVLKEVTGAAFRDHVVAIRMVKAKELLESTRLEVKEVAGRVGYKHVSHFSRHFKFRHGISATEYRRRSYAMKRRNLR